MKTKFTLEDFQKFREEMIHHVVDKWVREDMNSLDDYQFIILVIDIVLAFTGLFLTKDPDRLVFTHTPKSLHKELKKILIKHLLDDEFADENIDCLYTDLLYTDLEKINYEWQSYFH